MNMRTSRRRFTVLTARRRSSFSDATMDSMNIEAGSAAYKRDPPAAPIIGRRAKHPGFTERWKNSNSRRGKAWLGCAICGHDPSPFRERNYEKFKMDKVNE